MFLQLFATNHRHLPFVCGNKYCTKHHWGPSLHVFFCWLFWCWLDLMVDFIQFLYPPCSKECHIFKSMALILRATWVSRCPRRFSSKPDPPKLDQNLAAKKWQMSCARVSWVLMDSNEDEDIGGNLGICKWLNHHQEFKLTGWLLWLLRVFWGLEWKISTVFHVATLVILQRY